MEREQAAWCRIMALLFAVDLAVRYPWSAALTVPVYLATEVRAARLARQQMNDHRTWWQVNHPPPGA